MVKSLTGLWLKNIRRMGEAQQAQGRKRLTSLMPKPARSAPVRRAKVVGAARLKVAAPRQKSVAVPVRP
ncbi:MAG: esterase, partial [Polaromonas sp.]|nr:esterase [Polaromonas sp.]